MTIISVDPRTGLGERLGEDSTPEEVRAACRRAAAAQPHLEALGRHGRAGLLRAIADEIEADAEELVALADRETALGPERLSAELVRTVHQLRFFAEVLHDGAYLEATIDHAGETPPGARPDLRRINVPIGPVAVFTASNFPLAFSVPGGDVAAALAAGCAVIIKAHPAHPQTAQRSYAALTKAVANAGGLDGAIGIIFGVDGGATLAQHPAIRAIAFTGSVDGGRALSRLAASRPDPIPFFGELSSVNALVVTPQAAAARGREIGADAVASFTLGSGQFCTKPGLLFVPRDAAGQSIIDAAVEALARVKPGYLLNAGVHERYRRSVDVRSHLPGVTATTGQAASGDGFSAGPVLLRVRIEDLAPDLLAECFGPISVIVEYGDGEQLTETLRALPGALTATIHGDPDDPLAVAAATAMRDGAGRVVWNGFPTGVSVTWAMHHGGPWPSAADARETSVGAGAIQRFVRPVCYQNTPSTALPPELRDDYTAIPRRVDGKLQIPAGLGHVVLPRTPPPD
ncbi:aldehyde dehydrogenase (NADP(+)) [Rhizomonospora bruguierae]|uniref:aldehyde dehydrogenase (NADP(+)) n=1 Tax=Rhizomonospora bruguierae TaxID=1581705 RepID=UPI001BD133E0|nr:aldehyde dehydrogenase (NADP(+)) [Micromonospora sp. NBRC 107566]